MTDPLTGDPTIGADGSITVGNPAMIMTTQEDPMETTPKRSLDADGDGQGDYSTPSASTQVAHPWRASLRSALAALLPVLVLAVIAVPEVVQAILTVAGEQGVTLPPWLRGALAGAAVLCAFLVAVANRLMLLPTVNALLTRLGAGPRPAEEG